MRYACIEVNHIIFLQHNSETAILKVMNDLLLELDKGNVVILALLNLWAALDTVDNEIILNMLKTDYGYTDEVLQDSIGSQHSKLQTLHFSVPQGSVMGPQLYCKSTKRLSDIIKLLLLLFPLGESLFNRRKKYDRSYTNIYKPNYVKGYFPH